MGIKTGRAGSFKASSDYFISLRSHNGDEYPEHVLVRYAPQPTSTRPPKTPPPSNGFDCAGSPFDHGHVCALELGGPDISENIVPQWRYWQENGAWRSLERDDIPMNASKGDLLLFRVIWLQGLNFSSATPPQADVSHYDAFSAENLIHWDDYRIPRSFQFWHIAQNTNPYKSMSKGLGTDDLSGEIQVFLSSAGGPLFTRSQDQMPAEDHAQLERKQIVNATTEFMEAMKELHGRRVANRANKLMSGGSKMNSRQAAAEAVRLLGKFERGIVMKEFGIKHAKLFQKLLRARFNFDDTEVGHFTASRIVSAHDDGAYPKIAVKRVRTRAEALKHKTARDMAKAEETYRNVLVAEAASVLGE